VIIFILPNFLRKPTSQPRFGEINFVIIGDALIFNVANAIDAAQRSGP
jgi:hypothetical protein